MQVPYDHTDSVYEVSAVVRDEQSIRHAVLGGHFGDHVGKTVEPLHYVGAQGLV